MGKNIGGHVRIERGGSILGGPVFEISMEVYLESIETAIYPLTCMHVSTKTGGFLFYYWAAARQMRFDFSDGKQKFSFTATLESPIPLRKWVPLRVTYDGGTAVDTRGRRGRRGI